MVSILDTVFTFWHAESNLVETKEEQGANVKPDHHIQSVSSLRRSELQRKYEIVSCGVAIGAREGGK